MAYPDCLTREGECNWQVFSAKARSKTMTPVPMLGGGVVMHDGAGSGTPLLRKPWNLEPLNGGQTGEEGISCGESSARMIRVCVWASDGLFQFVCGNRHNGADRTGLDACQAILAGKLLRVLSRTCGFDQTLVPFSDQAQQRLTIIGLCTYEQAFPAENTAGGQQVE